MVKARSWTVTLDGTKPASEVSSRLKKAGFSKVMVLDAIGVITGSADQTTAVKAKRLSGVAEVEPDMAVSIGPPGATPIW
jgi:hypothetical protein